MNRATEELTELVAELPGLGPRQARRIVQFLLSKGGAYRERLTKLIAEVAKSAKQCAACFRYDDLDQNGLCRICADGSRDGHALMVVEKDVDIEGVEASGAYRGIYFVLGGLMSMTKRGGQKLRDAELLSRIAKDGLEEVIFGLSTTPEGDYTARELVKAVNTAHPGVKTTLLGRGLSVGAEIEYADSETIRNALKNRA